MTAFSRPVVLVSVFVLVIVLNLLILAQAALDPIDLSASAQTDIIAAQIEPHSVVTKCDPETGRSKALIGSISKSYQTDTEAAASAEGSPTNDPPVEEIGETTNAEGKSQINDLPVGEIGETTDLVTYSSSKRKSSKGSSSGYSYIKGSNDLTTLLETATGSYSKSGPGRDTQATVPVDPVQTARSAGNPVLIKMSNDLPYNLFNEAFLWFRELWLAAIA